VLEAEGANEAGNGTAASAFVQLAWPWLQTVRSDDLPQRLEPAEGLLAGVLARNALARGTFRSVAGTPLPQVVTPEPVPDLGLGLDSPTARLAERVCLIGPEPDGISLLSDVTSAPDSAWRPGGVSRLMATLIRAALRVGEAQLFEANGPELWTRVRRSFEELLGGFYRAGALGGKSEAEAFQVRCDRTTMSQNDLDNGRLRAEITVLPAAAIERITVSLELFSGRAEARLSEVA
jgi:phage tail sheath protein FI